MKSVSCLLAAGFFLLPAGWAAAEKPDIHTVMTVEEGQDAAASAAQKKVPEEEHALNEEMDELGDAALDARAETASAAAEKAKEETASADGKEPSAEKIGYGYGTDAPISADEPAHTTSVYAELTAIAPVTLKNGDWVFIEGDERRGWFFDRSRMTRNEDGSISYWQLILYNDLGRDQFVRAMHDEAYETLGYTLQRRVLDPKENTIRTYEIIAYDRENAVLTDGDRDGHAAEIHPNTMAAKERDAVKMAAKKLKNKRHAS